MAHFGVQNRRLRSLHGARGAPALRHHDEGSDAQAQQRLVKDGGLPAEDQSTRPEGGARTHALGGSVVSRPEHTRTTDKRRGVQGLKLWQRRYFVFSLEGECVLRYFGDENEARSSEPRGTIDLGGAVIWTARRKRAGA